MRASPRASSAASASLDAARPRSSALFSLCRMIALPSGSLTDRHPADRAFDLLGGEGDALGLEVGDRARRGRRPRRRSCRRRWRSALRRHRGDGEAAAAGQVELDPRARRAVAARAEAQRLLVEGAGRAMSLTGYMVKATFWSMAASPSLAPKIVESVTIATALPRPAPTLRAFHRMCGGQFVDRSVD